MKLRLLMCCHAAAVALEKMSAEQKKEFVVKAQPGLFAYDEGTGLVRVLEGASRRLVNMDELLAVGQLCAPDTKAGESVVSVSILPGRYWFRVEVSLRYESYMPRARVIFKWVLQTNGSLPAEQVVLCALEVLQNKLNKLHEAVAQCAVRDLGETVGGAGGGIDAGTAGSRYL